MNSNIQFRMEYSKEKFTSLVILIKTTIQIESTINSRASSNNFCSTPATAYHSVTQPVSNDFTGLEETKRKKSGRENKGENASMTGGSGNVFP